MENKKKITSPLKAIRAFCLDCSGDSAAEVKSCTSTKCPLNAFRFGKNPYRHYELTDEQRLAVAERARKMREAKEKKA